jgi:acetyl/propionyl-CoA carboxylase alpha subunit/acetyl-CoA carboxylase carboxyltransferase component
MMRQIEVVLTDLRRANPGLCRSSAEAPSSSHRLHKVLVANRGEIAKRFFFALKEEGIPSVAVVTDPDRKQSWYEFADEVVYIGDAGNYTNIKVILAAAVFSEAGAVYPGYGFLAENYRFVEALDDLSRALGRRVVFMGPPAKVMRDVGQKLDARKLAKNRGVPVLEGTEKIRDPEEARNEAARIGYPLMVKLSAGGGGKGMAVVRAPEELLEACESARRIGRANYGDDALYFERYVERPVHFEVQIFNGMAVGIRKCAVQRKNQKIIEESGEFFLNDRTALQLLAAAESVAAISGYADGGGAGTVEFLLDADTGEFGFLEVNARLQVEYPVTDQSLRIDLVKWQILLFDGREEQIPYEQALRVRFGEKDHAIECRIYAEDPWTDYAPSPGLIRDIDLPTFNGVRCDVGFKAGDSVLPNYDPMIGKIIAYGRDRNECLARLERALGEFYIRGITTNVDQLLRIVRNPAFRSGEYTNRLLDDPAESRMVESGAEVSMVAAAFCSLCELVHAQYDILEASLTAGDLENILQRGTLTLSPAFTAEIQSRHLRIDFIQLGLELYAAFVNYAYLGDMQVSQRVRGSGDYLIIFRGRSYPVRADRRASYCHLRIGDAEGIHYYRVLLRAIGAKQESYPAGAVRCPFQASFVKIAADASGAALRVGARVNRGDPLVVIEAMKMESTLVSPVSGTIKYLGEDGSLERRAPAKSLAEGELLLLVGEENAAPPSEFHPDPIEFEGEPHDVFAHILDPTRPDGGLASAVLANPAGVLSRVLALVHGYYLGYVQGDEISLRLGRCLEALKGSEVSLEAAEGMLVDIVDTFSSLKQIYSSALGVNQTWFGEMNRLVLEWENETYSPPPLFRAVMRSLREKYGIPHSKGKRSTEMRLALFHLLRGYAAVRDGRHLIGGLFDLMIARPPIPRKIRASLLTLIRQEQSERDDSLAKAGRTLLARPYAPGGGGEIRQPADPVKRTAARLKEQGPLIAESGGPRDQVLAALRHSEEGSYPSDLPPWVGEELAAHTGAWSRRYRVDHLPSPLPTVLVYRLTPLDGGPHRYATIAWLEEGAPLPETDSHGHIRSAPNMEKAAIQAGRVLATCHEFDPGEHNMVEILACGHPLELDLAGSDPAAFNHQNLLPIGGRLARFFMRTRTDFVLVHLNARRAGAAASERKILNFHLRHGHVHLDLMQDTDRLNPLWSGISIPRDQRLFDQGKWPLEIWVRECFDPGSPREILIASIDGGSAQPPGQSADRGAGDTAIRATVGAKLYEGSIAGSPALFYLKDSRVNGGATGDLEGRKYVAACYYAYMRDMSLYVWNDGAGANVRQGMVALNRAAQGFMMNALTSHGMSYDRFLAIVRSVEDPVLRDLFSEIDNAFGLQAPMAGFRGARSFKLIAVGVGSSTGLDVYGSSQACVQIMLDSEQSYRVLTGSNVIRATTGESLSNYEIGGARVMAQWTGTVDLVARDHIELLRHVRRVHVQFSGNRHQAKIARARNRKDDPAGEFVDAVLNEHRIAANVDENTFIPFKSEYVEAGALVGGFAKLGGKGVLVMGPRTDAGVRSFASLVRTKELLRTANKTRSPKILVFGRRWYRAVEGEDVNAVQAQMDLVHQLSVPGTPRIHIVTRPEGLLLVTLNTRADATIYVRRTGESEKNRLLAQKIATFQVDSLEQAFDLANRVLGLLDRDAHPLDHEPPERLPRIPTETSQPFDMVADVVEAVFDAGSFLEFHREGDEPGGSTLITGLATLGGSVTGVIADQPLGGGAPDATGTEKFRVFMEFLDRHGFPLVMLSNAPGFVPGTKQERLRIQQIGGESLDVNVLSTIPVVSVVLNQNYGGRQIHAFSRFLRPGIAYIALDRAILAVMGASAAFDLFHGSQHRDLLARGMPADAERMQSEFLETYNRNARAVGDAAATGVLDWTVPEPADLRTNIMEAMIVARAKADAAFGQAGDDGAALEPSAASVAAKRS